MSKKSGVIEIKFKEDTPQYIVEKVINDLYVENSNHIHAMQWREFKTEEDLVELHRIIDKWSQKEEKVTQ